jgi:hypothetical protein
MCDIHTVLTIQKLNQRHENEVVKLDRAEAEKHERVQNGR